MQINGYHIEPGASLQGADLRGANLGGAELHRANLRGANLEGADLHFADLSRAHLKDANLRGANLRGADLRGADLRGANLEGADLQETCLDIRVTGGGGYGDLCDYETGDTIRPATPEEHAESRFAARKDGGVGVVVVDGRRCYVERDGGQC